MRRKDKGSIQKLLSLIMILWAVVLCNVVLGLRKAEYINQHLEDSLMQANLAAILVDPYHYGATGELTFSDVEETKKLFWETLCKALGSDENKKELGIKDVELEEFRVYETAEAGIMEAVWKNNSTQVLVRHESEEAVYAPDGTKVESCTLYAKIKAKVSFVFGIDASIWKEHCVDIVREDE